MTQRPVYRVGQNRIYAPYMTVYLVISLPKIAYTAVYIWFWPTLHIWSDHIVPFHYLTLSLINPTPCRTPYCHITDVYALKTPL